MIDLKYCANRGRKMFAALFFLPYKKSIFSPAKEPYKASQALR